jgi:uncharacterized membrane protein YphA (DoxX/SURF4 family)
LILRGAVGVTAIVQGVNCLLNLAKVTAGSLAVEGISIVCGASLLIGFLTPLAATLIAAGLLGIILSWLPVSASAPLDSNLSDALAIAMALAIGLLGPGAFSVDAQLFGRREIIIPPVRRGQDQP